MKKFVAILVLVSLVDCPAVTAEILMNRASDSCPPGAICFPPATEFFDSSYLSPHLRLLGLTGNEQFQCTFNGSYRCMQGPVQGVLTGGFQLHVQVWSTENDIKSISCHCVSEDTPLPEAVITQEQAFAIATRYTRANLLAAPEDLIEQKQAILLLTPNSKTPGGFELVWYTQISFRTLEHKATVLGVVVNALTAHLVRAIDNKKAIDRKGFSVAPWNELGRRLLSTPWDLALFREYQSYGAFRGRGTQEAEFQDAHRQALGRRDPTGESLYYATFREPLTIRGLVDLLDGHNIFIHRAGYMVSRGEKLYVQQIEDIETVSGPSVASVEQLVKRQVEIDTDWIYPAFPGVYVNENYERSADQIRFTNVTLQANHLDALELWTKRRSALIALTPLTNLGSSRPPNQKELREGLKLDDI